MMFPYIWSKNWERIPAKLLKGDHFRGEFGIWLDQKLGRGEVFHCVLPPSSFPSLIFIFETWVQYILKIRLMKKNQIPPLPPFWSHPSPHLGPILSLRQSFEVVLITISAKSYGIFSSFWNVIFLGIGSSGPLGEENSFHWMICHFIWTGSLSFLRLYVK